MYIKNKHNGGKTMKETQSLRESQLTQGSHRELARVIPYVYDADVTLLLHGHMGIGKTAFFRQLAIKKAEELGLEFSESFSDINDESKFIFLSFIAHQMDMAEDIAHPHQEARNLGKLLRA